MGEHQHVLEQSSDRFSSYVITVQKGLDGKRLGIKVSTFMDTDLLYIRAIKDNGLVGDWNRDNPELQVEEGDAILEVNGARGGGQIILETIAMSTVLHIRFSKF